MTIKMKLVRIVETKNKVRYHEADSQTVEAHYFRKEVLGKAFGTFPEILYMAISSSPEGEKK